MTNVISRMILYCLLFTSTFTINKYVLSVLKFQYPTIFQGWQTLFGLCLLTLLSYIGSINIDAQQLTIDSIYKWSPYFATFIVVIYSGSVALSKMAVPIFMSYHNFTTVFHVIIDRWIITGKIITAKEYLSITAILISSLFITQVDTEIGSAAQLWMLFHVIATVFLIIFPKLCTSLPHINDITRLYLCHIFSVVLLLPSTVLLGDALAAKNFEFWYYYRFYLSCVLSGILGVYLNILTVDLTQRMHTYSATLLMDATSTAKICVSVTSLLLFDQPLSTAQLTWCFINLCSGTLITDLNSKVDSQNLSIQTVEKSKLVTKSKLSKSCMKPSRSDNKFMLQENEEVIQV